VTHSPFSPFAAGWDDSLGLVLISLDWKQFGVVLAKTASEWVTIMLKSPETDTAAADSVAVDRHRPTRPFHVLIAEDAKCVQQSVDAIAGRMNMEVDVAADGQIACHLAKVSGTEGKPYDLILMDMVMPNMDGVAATEWLRRNHWVGPIIAISVFASEESRNQAISAGCDAFIAKPLTDKKLRAVIARLSKQYDNIANMLLAADEAECREQGNESQFHGKLLVAEDARCAQMALGSLLRHLEIQADMVDNGQAACDMAMKSLTEGKPYDAILMDVQMPKMNGKQAASWLRNHGWDGPIIAVSVHASDKDHAEFLKAGCDDYLCKPVTEATLRDVLCHYLNPVA
jgi:CheY-like chemotaxis protein